MLLHHRTICNGSAVWALYVVQHVQWFMSKTGSLSSPLTSEKHIKFMSYYIFLFLVDSLEDVTAVHQLSILN